MVGKLHLLLAACVVAVLGNEGDLGCVHDHWGKQNDQNKVELKPRLVGPGDSDLNYSSELPLGCGLVGVKTVMCTLLTDDAGPAAPTLSSNRINFRQQLKVHTHRDTGAAQVFTTIFCGGPCSPGPGLGGCLNSEEIKKPVARATQQVKAECPPSGC